MDGDDSYLRILLVVCILLMVAWIALPVAYLLWLVCP